MKRLPRPRRRPRRRRPTPTTLFGDLGPLYASCYIPSPTPRQGLLVAAASVLLARQPLATVRVAYAALAVCGALAVAAHAIASPQPLGLRATGLAAALLGLAALSGLRLPCPSLQRSSRPPPSPPASPATCRRRPARPRSSLGAPAGIALLALLVWGGVDLLVRRFGPVAGAVAGAWVAAVGIMAAALPA